MSTKIDIEKERARLQAIFDGPNTTALDRALFDDVVGKGSAPAEWSPQTVESAYLMCRIYIMGWEGHKREASTEPSAPVAYLVRTKRLVGEWSEWETTTEEVFRIRTAHPRPDLEVIAVYVGAGALPDEAKTAMLTAMRKAADFLDPSKGVGPPSWDAALATLRSAIAGAGKDGIDEAKDAARLNAFIDWFIRGGARHEIHELAHIAPTTREHVLASLDAAIAQSKAGKPA